MRSIAAATLRDWANQAPKRLLYSDIEAIYQAMGFDTSIRLIPNGGLYSADTLRRWANAVDAQTVRLVAKKLTS